MKKCTSFEEQKGTRYIWGNVYFGIIVFSWLSSTKLCQISCNLFCSGDKRLLSEFLRSWRWFQGDNKTLPQISWMKIKMAKNWDFVDEKALIISTLIFSFIGESLYLFAYEGKVLECIFSSIHELSRNRTEKLMPSKSTINWLFNNICYLFIAYYDWKIGFFQQVVVRVYYMLKCIFLGNYVPY